jgi:predicted metal-dependent hydrolase
VIEVNLREGDETLPDLHEKIRRKILVLYKKQAALILRERLDHWAKALDVRYRSFSVGDAKNLWGTCGARNDIRINWRILMASWRLVDYLLAHELCHILHKNHSHRFWTQMASVMPDYEARRKELHALGPELLSRGR